MTFPDRKIGRVMVGEVLELGVPILGVAVPIVPREPEEALPELDELELLPFWPNAVGTANSNATAGNVRRRSVQKLRMEPP
jgi:hypothetical protein